MHITCEALAVFKTLTNTVAPTAVQSVVKEQLKASSHEGLGREALWSKLCIRGHCSMKEKLHYSFSLHVHSSLKGREEEE